jgi:RNA-directed DNA polymerase
LKALSLVLIAVLPVSPYCMHVEGHGSAKAAVRDIKANLAQNPFVLRTDGKSYYASIGHVAVMERLSQYIQDKTVLNLCGSYLKYWVEQGGVFSDCNRGISLRCPLSLLIGAVFLTDLNERMTRTGLFYRRFMDDILVLAPSRWTLRAAVKMVNDALSRLDLEKHPDKAFIGRIARGFDFLGYHIAPGGLSIARDTKNRFIAQATQLCEQERKKRDGASKLGGYVQRWLIWRRAGLTGSGQSRSN